MFDSPSGLTKAAPYIFTIDNPITHANPVIKLPADNLIIEIILGAITDESQMFKHADIMLLLRYVIIVLI